MGIPIFILVGPTASGKTKLALHLAYHFHAEIVCADSMTVYRGMDIGTAKPDHEERKLVPHHLVDIYEPYESYSAGIFVEHASRIIAEIRARGREVLLVGGTALYIKTLLEGIFNGPSANWELRHQLESRDSISLYRELCDIDLETAQKVLPNDQRRIIRALEVFYTTGISISRYRRDMTKPTAEYSPCFIGIQWERTVLYKRIEERVDAMLQKGLVEETRGLLQLPRPLSHTASQAIGYKETIEAIQNTSLMDGLAEKIKLNTRHFAKRQMTWLRHFPVHWIQASEQENPEEMAEKAIKTVTNSITEKLDSGRNL